MQKAAPWPPFFVEMLCVGAWFWFIVQSFGGQRGGPSYLLSAIMGQKLLGELRRVLRTRHYSRRTERAYVSWARRFVLFHGRRHPAEMG